MWKTILDLFFPMNCLGCGREGQFICPACLEKIPLNQKVLFGSNQAWPLTGLIVASNYNNPLVKEAIHRYKYGLVKDLANPLGQLATRAFREYHFKDTLLIPVPLHKKRLRWRGFNQAELLAQVVSRQLEIPLVKDVLRRVKYRLPQMAIKNSRQRRDNIKEAFRLSPQLKTNIQNKIIILVDDVVTTGATLSECARLLKSLQPREIWGLVVARG